MSIFKRIWKNYIPTRVGYFYWKLLHDAVHVDSTITKCRIPMVSKGVCCLNPKIEVVKHLFLHSDLVNKAWIHFSNVFDVQWPKYYTISNVLSIWFSQGKARSLHQLYASLVFVLVLWELGRTNVVEDLIMIIYIIPLRLFSKPPDGYVALNTDGASKDGLAAGEGELKNLNGEEDFISVDEDELDEHVRNTSEGCLKEAETQNGQGPVFPAHLVWKVEMPAKCQLFMWHTILKRTLTKDNLIRRRTQAVGGEFTLLYFLLTMWRSC
ncbi:hypothetical protein FRX31_025712 [Thalictrum thalictroides]|uniref:Reverse transcriptase zinc-binding domain-containing protein n=1 Tax=Thalictrum thalictroides TaxID=46969 RepID=A0A7J6VK51_THATH|nr:hypothetical protein FRX31_025712 [Thalictrum thalictroides]